ncbi:hypothetical protein GCM10008957_53670 [Deinococcus ruber]|uniref:Transcriptional regulator LacI/GalR-like sensor domain-containing protein n=2 Tax=Deinococcus ruber TaxID=1848197 RepID=A0A918KWQ0_9DEIO|nr:hypothetical protein GCM10008957_53670 [Deinococcus ruber]
MALGITAALNAKGFSVPQDVSVVGFDDTPEATYVVPGLTTVRQDFAQLGYTSVDVLLRKMATPAGQLEHVVFVPCLITRQSTAPAVQ